MELDNSSIDLILPSDKKLFHFQYEGVKFLVERTRGLLASDPGTGKTVMLIVAVGMLADCKTDTPLRVLVLCPKSILLNWEREIQNWSIHTNIEWTVRNWDQLISEKKVEEIASNKWDIVIGDESHVAIKNPDAQRCRTFLEKIVPITERVWLATATPASRSALDYYCTLKVLLPTIFESWRRRDFEKEFCAEVKDPWAVSGKRYEGFKNTHILKEVFQKCAVRHKKAEVLPDLPPKIYQNIPVAIKKDIAAEYLNIDEDYVMACIEDGRPLPGHIAHVMQATALAKIDSAVEIIGNFPEYESLVVFCWHRSVVEALKARLNFKRFVAPFP